MFDAASLRRQVGQHAKEINSLKQGSTDYKPLRERMGYTRLEIDAGVLVGILVAVAVKTTLTA